MAPDSRRACPSLAVLLLAVIAALLRASPSAAQNAQPAVALTAPALSAKPAVGAVEISWTQVTGAARYELIAWWDAAADWQQIGGDNLTGVAYDHASLTIGATYHYRIRAVDAGGQMGPWSELVSAVPHADIDAPRLSAQPEPGAVELTWNAVPDAARYELITWWKDASGWQQIGGNNLTATSFPHTGLTVGVTYYHQIRARNAAGEPGPWSEQASTTVTEADPSAPAQTSTPTPTLTLTPTLTPTPTSTPTQTPTPPPPPTVTPTPGAPPPTDPTPTSTPTDTPLPAGPTHTPTTTATPTPTAASSQTAPQLTATGIEGAVDLSWSQRPGAVRYELLAWWPGAPDWQPIGGDNLTGTAYRHADQTPGVTYHYIVRTVDAAGIPGPWSQTVSATVLAPPSTNVTATPTPTPTPAESPTSTPTATQQSGSTYVIVSRSQLSFVKELPNMRILWTAVLGAVHYNVYYCLSVSDASDICRTSLFFRSAYEFVGRELTFPEFLHENITKSPDGAVYTHYYLVQACLRSDCPILTRQEPTATPTPTLTATPTVTPTPTPTSEPSAISPPALTAAAAQNAIELRWNAVPGATRYELITWRQGAGEWQRIGGTNLTAATFIHTTVSAGTTYHYAARTVNAAGKTSPWSAYATAALPAGSTPTPTPTPSPTPTANRQVSSPLPSLEVPPYYKKYLSASGIPILSSLDVTDEELYQARDTILAIISDRPDILKTMVDNRFRVLIYPDRFEKGGRLGDLPEFKGLDLSTRAVGAAGKTPYGWVSGSPEVAGHCNHVLIHEFAHQIEDALRMQPGGSDFMASLNSAYQAAMLRGLWQDRYASTNALEYWAEIVRLWLTPSQFAGWLGPGYQILADYDPVGAALVADVLGNPTPLTFCEIQRFDLRGKINGLASQPPDAGSHILQLSMRTPVGAKKLLGTSTAVRRTDGTFAFERLDVEKHFLATAGEKPHIVIGIYRYQSGGSAACPAAAFLGPNGALVRSTDPNQWQRIQVTGDHITNITFTLPAEFNWSPLYHCI